MLLSSLFFQLSLLEGALSLCSVSCTSLIQWSSNILTVTHKQKICNLYGMRLKQNAAGMHFNYEIRYTVPKGVPLVQLSDITANLMEFLDPNCPSGDFPASNRTCCRSSKSKYFEETSKVPPCRRGNCFLGEGG